MVTSGRETRGPSCASGTVAAPEVAVRLIAVMGQVGADASFQLEVHWRAATVAGIVGGTLWLLMNIFTSFQLSKVVSMSAIYGSVFAIIPIFLLGLYFSFSEF